jgi:hypothetical protein
MRPLRPLPLATALLPLLVATTAAAGPIDDLVAGTKVSLDLRYRLETVSQDGFAEDAIASTLRARLGATSGSHRGVSLYADFEVIGTVGPDDYNSTTNGLTQFPQVSDPTGSELNQAYLQWKEGDWQVRYGRQRFVLDNHRFIGNVGFRQNEQTFDGLTGATKLGEGTITGAWLENANRIFGEANPNPLLANTPLEAAVLHYGLPLWGGKLSAYAHFFEYEQLPLSSHQNLGVRFAGEAAGLIGEGKLRYAFEFAQQDSYADGAATIDQDYLLAEAGYVDDFFDGKTIGVRFGLETLGGDGVRGFQTPFATLHAFNGWADRFLTTPVNGLVDAYAKADCKHGAWTALIALHDFSADATSTQYGQEFDLGVHYAHDARTTLKLEYADYSAESFATDTRILWLSAEYKY